MLWNFPDGPVHGVLLAGYGVGWVWLVTTTFSLDHFELFGLKVRLGDRDVHCCPMHAMTEHHASPCQCQCMSAGTQVIPPGMIIRNCKLLGSGWGWAELRRGQA